jgi:hypothetical protein
MDHHPKIEDLPLRHLGLEEVDTPRSSSFRGAERPPWPKIAAAKGADAWDLPPIVSFRHGEHRTLTSVPLNSRSANSRALTLLSVSTTTRRRKSSLRTHQTQSQREVPGSLIRRGEDTTRPLLLASTAGQTQLHRVPQEASPLPLASMAGQGRLCFAASRHHQKICDLYFICGDRGSLLASMLQPPES